MSELGEFSELLALLHSAPLDPTNWRRFMDRICLATGTVGGVLITEENGPPRILTGSGNCYDPKALELYNAYYWQVDPWRRVRALQGLNKGVHLGESLAPRAEFEKSEFYNDFFVPFGFETITLSVFRAEPDRFEVLSLLSGKTNPRMSPEACELMRRLLPHLQIALDLDRTLFDERRRAANAEAILDRLAVAAFLLSSTGDLLHMNYAAVNMVRVPDGIAVRRERLVVYSAGQQSTLDRMIANAGVASDASDAFLGKSLALSRPSGRRALQLRVFPLRDLGCRHASPGRVLVLVTDPELVPRQPEWVLRDIFGFTAAEAQIANQLMAGLSVEEIAEARAVSIGTVRVQLKCMLGKTGTCGQADLLRLLLSVPQATAGARS